MTALPRGQVEAAGHQAALQGIWVLPRFSSCRPATTEDRPGPLCTVEAQVHVGFCLTHTAQALKYVYKRVSPKSQGWAPGAQFAHCFSLWYITRGQEGLDSYHKDPSTDWRQ